MWPVYRHGTTNIDIKLGFHWQMSHVESTNDVVHLHNIERLEEFYPVTPHLEVENL